MRAIIYTNGSDELWRRTLTRAYEKVAEVDVNHVEFHLSPTVRKGRVLILVLAPEPDDVEENSSHVASNALAVETAAPERTYTRRQAAPR